MENFTGDRKVYINCLNYLLEKGFEVSNAIHIGNNKYEFKEPLLSDRMGCHDIHVILAWVEVGEGVKYKTKVSGWSCTD